MTDEQAAALSVPPEYAHLDRDAEWLPAVAQMTEDLGRLARADGCVAAAWALSVLAACADELGRWRAAARRVLDQKFDDACWMDVYREAAAMLGVGWRPELLPKPVMMRNCDRFVDAMIAGGGYATPPALPAVEAALAFFAAGLPAGPGPDRAAGAAHLAAAAAEMRAAGLGGAGR